MTIYKEHTRISLVEGGNVFKQGENVTLGFVARDYAGNVIDLTGKDIAGVIYGGRKGIMYEAPATFDAEGQKIVFTIDEMLEHGISFIEFTATDPNDPEYRMKFPSKESGGEITIKPSSDNMDYVGVQMTTVTQLQTELQTMQTDFEGEVLPRVQTVEVRQNEVEATVEAGIAAFTEDTEVLLARGGEVNLGARLDKTTAQLAETDGKTKKIKEEFTPLYLPTWDGASDALHPSVIYNSINPVGGFEFWMVNTPLTGGNGYGDRWESPCVFRSHDGITWRVNSDAGNPLDNLIPSEIANEGYFSDPCIFQIGTSLEVWYRLTPNGHNYADTKILRKVSTDGGVTWGARQVVFDPTINNGDVGMNWYPRSLQVLYEGGKYIMYYTTDAGMERIETVNPIGSVWTNKLTIAYNGPLIWHFTIARHSSGKLHMVAYSANDESVGYLIGETDLSFDYKKKILALDENVSLSAERFYQSAVCFVGAETYVYGTLRSQRSQRWRTILLKGDTFENLHPVKGELEESRKVHADHIVLANSLKPNGKKDLMFKVYESDNGLEYNGYGYDLDNKKPIFRYKNVNRPIPLVAEDNAVNNVTVNPIVAPDYTGELQLFTQTKKAFMGFGTASKDDWIELMTLPRIVLRTFSANPITAGAIPHYPGQIGQVTATGEIYIGAGTTSASWVSVAPIIPKQNAAFVDGFAITNNHYKIVFNTGTAGTLSSLSGGNEGQEIILVNALTADITIVSNTVFILRGKVNRVMKQYEAIKLTKTSGMWMEI